MAVRPIEMTGSQPVRPATQESLRGRPWTCPVSLAASHSDRIAVLGTGRLLADGPPDAVPTADLLSRTYGHAIEVLPHPRTGRPIVLPCR